LLVATSAILPTTADDGTVASTINVMSHPTLSFFSQIPPLFELFMLLLLCFELGPRPREPDDANV
jgi:hypothetical protein